MKTVVSQPRYLPSLNYINRLAKSEKFVFLDTVQRQPRGFENRNRLLQNGETKWLTMPIESSSRSAIVDTRTLNNNWIDLHKNKIVEYYKKAPYFDASYLDVIYEGVQKNDFFVDATIRMIKNVFSHFNINMAEFEVASSLDLDKKNWLKGPSELYRICKLCDATVYISGPNGRDYGVKNYFKDRNMDLVFHDYRHPIYNQYGTKTFYPYMGFIDSIFNCGDTWFKDQVEKDLEIKID